jgi:hypothetical protein
MDGVRSVEKDFTSSVIRCRYLDDGIFSVCTVYLFILMIEWWPSLRIFKIDCLFIYYLFKIVKHERSSFCAPTGLEASQTSFHETELSS